MHTVGTGLSRKVGPIVDQQGDIGGTGDWQQPFSCSDNRLVAVPFQAKLQARDVPPGKRPVDQIRKVRTDIRWANQIEAAARIDRCRRRCARRQSLARVGLCRLRCGPGYSCERDV
jgi:hypothetical protein